MSEQLDHTDEPTLADFRIWLNRAISDKEVDESYDEASYYRVALSVVEEFTQMVACYKQREGK